MGQMAFVTKIYSQNIAINALGSLPDTSAMLDVSSTNKGFLTPRVTTVQRNAIPLPANGLLIYNTTANLFNVNTGTAASPIWTNLATAGNNWALTGNSGISQPAVPNNYGSTTLGATENFLGTTDSRDLVLATNNLERARILNSNGYIGIATSSPNSPLHIAGPIATAITALLGNNNIITDAQSTVLIDMNGNSGRNLYLPTASNIAGRIYTIKRIGTGIGSLTLYGNGSQKIDANNAYSTLSSQWKYVTVQSDGSNWIVIANN